MQFFRQLFYLRFKLFYLVFQFSRVISISSSPNLCDDSEAEIMLYPLPGDHNIRYFSSSSLPLQIPIQISYRGY